ncbi:unnamed protein product, partial [Meganyctiphanes norvegica]
MSLNNDIFEAAPESNVWQDGVFYEKQKEIQTQMIIDEDDWPTSSIALDQAISDIFKPLNISFSEVDTLFDLLNDTSKFLGIDNAMTNVSSTPLDWEPWRDILESVQKITL